MPKPTQPTQAELINLIDSIKHELFVSEGIHIEDLLSTDNDKEVARMLNNGEFYDKA
ncbi:MAG: hypothetical protein HRU18_16770 [Pseudoalteromonas sp.]|uniref:hypothetical protein n=1 Tax=Pseudoalteromonas sp. TaxID=53249 RepID=UPI001D5A187E|nr:hypothetical protein [Pseudoalteromonas sp.]NRA79860.1 hypothetical protein [Pseudoalteromonas sp.]